MPHKVGVLLVNLGTPEATSYWPMRTYLKEFLSDPRVIEAKGPIWWLIFNGIILTKRPKSSGRAYDKIWNEELDESPLKTITRAQSDKLTAHYGDKIYLEWAMRYGKPPIVEGIANLRAKGCERILIFPLYPQYSSATTATVMDKTYEAFGELRHQPEIRSVPPYFNHPLYIEALADSVRAHHAMLDWQPQVTLASLHGLPQAFIDKGDPYQSHCETTVSLLCDALGMDTQSLRLTYQSRNGRTVWIGPDTEETLVDLAQSGVTNVSILTPGFAADCVETLEEINIRAAKLFSKHGGENFAFIPCLNASPPSISMLAHLIDEQLWADCK